MKETEQLLHFLGNTFLFLHLSKVFCSSCWESIWLPFGHSWEHIPLFFPCVHVNLLKIRNQTLGVVFIAPAPSPNPLGNGFHQHWELRARDGSGHVWCQAELWDCGGLCSAGKFEGKEAAEWMHGWRGEVLKGFILAESVRRTSWGGVERAGKEGSDGLVCLGRV